jgi:hypothetical protein
MVWFLRSHIFPLHDFYLTENYHVQFSLSLSSSMHLAQGISLRFYDMAATDV